MTGITFNDLVSALERRGKVTRTGDRVTACCPAHDDHSPSLDVDKGKNGKPILICRSQGCSFESIIDALNLKGVGYDKPEPYHIKKHVKLHSPAYLDENNLIVPLVDIDGKALGNIKILPEKIKTSNGKMEDKFNSKGLDTKQSMFVFGNLESSSNILVATGYSTSASLYESTGQAVVMTLSDTTLPATIALLRERYAEREMTICADHDARLAFMDTAKKHHAKLCYPDGIGEKADFNDLMTRHGKDAVCKVVNAARYIDDEPKSSVILRCADSLTPRAIKWLWEGWIAVGKVHLLAGPPGVAKSTIAFNLSAIFSSGGLLPDGTKAQAGHVLIWSSEDDSRDTILPRLLAAGGKGDHIHFVDGVADKKGSRAFDPGKDMPELQKKVCELNAGGKKVVFMVIDSIADAVSGDGAKNNQVRRALAPIKDFSEEMKIASLGITHFNKGISGKVMNRIIDSIAFVGLPRVVMVAFKKRNNGSLLMRAKSNIGPDSGGYEYYTFMEPLPGYDDIVANRIGWKGYVEGTADEHLQDAEAEGRPLREKEKAEDFLRELFSDGYRLLSSEVTEKAKEAGISVDLINDVKKRLGIVSKKLGSQWWMYAPPPPAADDDRKDIA